MKNIGKVLLACLIVSAGVMILKHSNIVTGGTAGLSLNISYLLDFHFFIIFFLINVPFYIFSFLTMGWKFTLNTIFAVTMLTIFTGFDPLLYPFQIPSLVGAIFGGLLIGLGLSYLFMNGSSLGGANILALFLQKKYGINPGKTNFIFDFIIVLTSIFSIGFFKLSVSVLSIGITSSIISYFKGKIAKSNDRDSNGEQINFQSQMKQENAV